MPALTWSYFDGDDSFSVVVHGVSIARIFRNLLHIMADGLSIVEFGYLVADCIGILPRSETVNYDGIALGEDPIVECTGLLGGHNQREAGATALPHPFNKGIRAGLGVT